MEQDVEDKRKPEKDDNRNEDKPKRSKLVAWNRSRVKNLDRQGRWDELEGEL